MHPKGVKSPPSSKQNQNNSKRPFQINLPPFSSLFIFSADSSNRDQVTPPLTSMTQPGVRDVTTVTSRHVIVTSQTMRAPPSGWREESRGVRERTLRGIYCKRRYFRAAKFSRIKLLVIFSRGQMFTHLVNNSIWSIVFHFFAHIIFSRI